MASAPTDPGPIAGRVDSSGRLVAADPELERLQAEAGSSIGASIAIPQLAAVVRVAQRLGIPISRRVLAAGREQDIDMWVRAVPEDGAVAITIERWTPRAASPPRLAAINPVDDDKLLPEPLTWSVDEQLRLITLSGPFAEMASADERELAGQPLTRLFRLQEGEGGEMPLLDALAARHGFSGQRIRLREGGQELDLEGTVILGDDGGFAGFEGSAIPVGGSSAGRPSLDGAIQTALRSPLDRIVQSATAMTESPDPQSSEEYSAYAADIATAARHLLSVIRSLGERADPTGTGEVDIVELTAEFGAEEIVARGGSTLSTQAVGPKIAWLRRREPSVWQQTRRWYSEVRTSLRASPASMCSTTTPQANAIPCTT